MVVVLSACMLQGRGWRYCRRMCQHLIGKALNASVARNVHIRKLLCGLEDKQLKGVWAKLCSRTSIFCFRFWFHPIFVVMLMKLPCRSSACVRLSVLFPNVFGTANEWLPLWNCFLAYHCVCVLYIAWARSVRSDQYRKFYLVSDRCTWRSKDERGAACPLSCCFHSVSQRGDMLQDTVTCSCWALVTLSFSCMCNSWEFYIYKVCTGRGYLYNLLAP